VTFEQLCALDPRLLDVLQEACSRAQAAAKRFCAVQEFARARAQLRRLVGPGRPGRHAILSQTRALLVAEERLAEQLPKCRGHQGHELVGGELVPHAGHWPD
jgi:hypothetical protein